MSDTPHDLAAELIRATIRARVNPALIPAAASLATDSRIDWQIVIDLAREHGVLPLLYATLGPLSVLPAHAASNFQADLTQNHLRNLHLFHELTKILAAMTSRGIRVLPYKGPTLAQFSYGDLSLRQAGDLDILVPHTQYDESADILRSLGLVAVSRSHDGEFDPHEYHLEFYHPHRLFSVELHWKVAGDLFSFEPDPEDLWKRGRDLPVAGRSMRIMSPEDNLLVLCAHGMKHYWSRLGWLCDLAELIRAEPNLDFKSAIHRARQLGGYRMVLLGLNLLHQVLGTPLPSEVLRSTSRATIHQAEELARHLFAPTPHPDDAPRGARMQLAGGGLLESLLFHLRARESWIDGLRFCFHRAVTPTVLERNWAKLPRSLAFLYYPIRPIRLLYKYAPRTLARAFRPNKAA